MKRSASILLGFVALCLTVAELYALHQGIDGMALAAYTGAMGLIFGWGGKTLWAHRQ